MVKVLLVEDDPRVIELYRNLLTPEKSAAPDNKPRQPLSFAAKSSEPKNQVSAEVELLIATNLHDAQITYTSFQPHLVIMDQQFPSFQDGPVEENGFKMLKFIKGGMHKNTTTAWNSAVKLPMDIVLAQGMDYAFFKEDIPTKIPEILNQTLQELNKRG